MKDGLSVVPGLPREHRARIKAAERESERDLLPERTKRAARAELRRGADAGSVAQYLAWADGAQAALPWLGLDTPAGLPVPTPLLLKVREALVRRLAEGATRSRALLHLAWRDALGDAMRQRDVHTAKHLLVNGGQGVRKVLDSLRDDLRTLDLDAEVERFLAGGVRDRAPPPPPPLDLDADLPRPSP